MCDIQSDRTPNVWWFGAVHCIYSLSLYVHCVAIQQPRTILVSVHIDRSIFEIIYR